MKLNSVYTCAVERLTKKLCSEALKHWEDGTLSLTNADCLARHDHDKQREKLHDALTKEGKDFVPYNV